MACCKQGGRIPSPHSPVSPRTTEGRPIGKNTPVRRVNQTELGLKDYLWLTSPAKINLHLETGAIRPDGYHEIRSIFAITPLQDMLGVRIIHSDAVGAAGSREALAGACDDKGGKFGGIRVTGDLSAGGTSGQASYAIRISGDFDCPLEKNLIYKAAIAYLKAISQGCSVAHDGGSATYSATPCASSCDCLGADRIAIDIICHKNIPTGAGLGGGSSNAATTLLALQELLPGHCATQPLAFSDLVELATSLGADIPFFLYNEPLALVEGIGDKVTPIQREKPLSIEVSPQPEIYSSTVGAYTALDKLYPKGRDFTFSTKELVTMIQQAPSAWQFFNIFQQVPEIMTPQVVATLAKLHKTHDFVALTGSGSAVFGVS